MPYGLYVSAEGAHAQSTRLDVIAHNMANVDTVGFKRELALFQARHAEAIEQGFSTPGSGLIDDIGGGIMVAQTKTDFSAGPLQFTGNRGDLAIRGEGFFVVEKGEEKLLTRAGKFTVAPNGRLITQQGYSVLDETGVPVVIRDSQWEISGTGAIRQQGGGQNLALVKPRSLGDLVRVGENLFRPLAEPEAIPPSQRSVVAGSVEASGVKPTSEMIAMIQTARALEANLNMMKTQDEMLSGLINRAMRV